MKWNDEGARKAYEAAGGKPASTGAQVEGAQNGETAIGLADSALLPRNRRGVGPPGYRAVCEEYRRARWSSPQSAFADSPSSEGAKGA